MDVELLCLFVMFLCASVNSNHLPDEILSRHKRQIPGVNFICVPPGTCNSNVSGGNIIDPRIVTPGATPPPPPPPPITCPVGTVACYGRVGAGACGLRYITGMNTTDGPTVNGAYPWLAFLRNQTGYTGAGVLIDQSTVLTAAHKVYMNQATPGNIQVYIGVWNPSNLGVAQMRTVSGIRIHPNFSASTLRNDIAVLRLNQPIPLGFQTNVGTACLPPASATYVGSTCTVAGWGQTAFNIYDAPTQAQRQVSINIVDYNTCRTSMAQPNVLGTNVDTYLDNNEICAGGQANRDACTQDGGSPLICSPNGQNVIAGLVIWGRNCGRPGVYGVYVNVANYRSWIDSAVNELTFG